MDLKKEKLKIQDMTCTNCEKKIEQELKKLSGVKNAIASYTDSSVIVEYNPESCSIQDIRNSIEKAGYSISGTDYGTMLGMLVIGVVLILLSNYTGGFDMSSRLGTRAAYIVLFIVGVLTSIHCVGMCGGIMISQSLNKNASSKNTNTFKPSVLYNLGRVSSYTILGGVVGALGSVFSVSLSLKGGISIFAGLFMVLMGVNLAGFKFFRALNLRLPFNINKIKGKNNAPFIVGLLNGFIPCGPLQTMQLYALSTGSMLKGASAMFVFSLGTVPLMLVFGLATGFLTKNYTKKILKFSGILIIFLGLSMANRGFALWGINIISPPEQQVNPAVAAIPINSELQNGVQIIHVTADSSGYSPNSFNVQKGIPVKMIIDAKQLTSCNNEIVIPEYKIQEKLNPGENVIQFTPKDKDIVFTCWMGMTGGIVHVKDSVGN